MSEQQIIPEAAVEAAARAMSPAVWGPQVWTFVAHGESPTGARNRVQRQSLEDARRALEAAAPHMLKEAWDDGAEAGSDNQCAWDGWRYSKGYPITNPYRPTP